jgi:hypothetical protein
MNRYLIFKYKTYYPGGGWRDFHGSFETLEEAQKVRREIHETDGETTIIDGETGEVLEAQYETYPIEQPCKSE